MDREVKKNGIYAIISGIIGGGATGAATSWLIGAGVGVVVVIAAYLALGLVKFFCIYIRLPRRDNARLRERLTQLEKEAEKTTSASSDPTPTTSPEPIQELVVTVDNPEPRTPSNHVLQVSYVEPHEEAFNGETFQVFSLAVETPFMAGDLSAELELLQTNEWGGDFPAHQLVASAGSRQTIPAQEGRGVIDVEIVRQSLDDPAKVLFCLPVTPKTEGSGRGIWCTFRVQNANREYRGAVSFWLVADEETRLLSIYNKVLTPHASSHLFR